MGYRDSDDSGFSRHGMNRDGSDHPDLNRDEDLRTRHSVPLDHRTDRNEAYGGRRDGPGYQGAYQGARAWDGRDRYQGQDQGGYRNSSNNKDDAGGFGYGARSPDIGGYAPHESEQRFRQQQYGGGGYGTDERARLNRPDGWAREGYGGYGRDPGHGDQSHSDRYGNRQGRSYGYDYDGRPDGGYGLDGPQDGGDRWDHRHQDAYGGYRDHGGSSYGRQQGNGQQYRSSPQQRHDPEYAAWRQEQLRLLDEDYDSWRSERYQKFSDEFNTWRSMRSRNEGLRGSNQSGQVTQTASASGASKTPQAGGTGSSATASAPGSKAKD